MYKQLEHTPMMLTDLIIFSLQQLKPNMKYPNAVSSQLTQEELKVHLTLTIKRIR